MTFYMQYENIVNMMNNIYLWILSFPCYHEWRTFLLNNEHPAIFLSNNKCTTTLVYCLVTKLCQEQYHSDFYTLLFAPPRLHANN